MARQRSTSWTFVAGTVCVLSLSACSTTEGFTFGGSSNAQSETSVQLIERDVEAPEVFHVTEAGLWDGRPSLGGIWVAHPDVATPERVIIRNDKNNKFVIGALFKRDIETSGPRIQVSSDAAKALGMLAGQPSNLNVTALRKQATEVENSTETAAPEAVTEEVLDSAPPTPVASAPASTPQPAASTLAKPYIQLGIFGVEANANNTAAAMRSRGIVPITKTFTSKGKTFWRVIVGPAQTKTELDDLFKTVKSAGFGDAYAVTN
jgi:hypothetical protein